jgi:hypothetical protein
VDYPQCYAASMSLQVSEKVPTAPAVFIDTAQRINAALDADQWQEAEDLAVAALDAARTAHDRRWAERFERLITFASARGHVEPPMPARIVCSFCAGGLNGDRVIAGAGSLHLLWMRHVSERGALSREAVLKSVLVVHRRPRTYRIEVPVLRHRATAFRGQARRAVQRVLVHGGVMSHAQPIERAASSPHSNALQPTIGATKNGRRSQLNAGVRRT